MLVPFPSLRRALGPALLLLFVGAAPVGAQTLPGVDVLLADDCRQLAGRKVGLITNHTGRTRDGRRTVDVLHAHEQVALVALFSPEHGFAGTADEKVGDSVDATTGIRVFSLYGETRVPTAAMLQDLDTLVFDVQDIGCRFYTYIATLRNALEAAAAHQQRFVVLDRPNPIGGIAVEGPLMPAERRDFVGAHTLPLRHGMTVGELARMFVGELGLDVELEVVPCRGWQRADLWPDTGLVWIDPSPNIRRVTQALTYPGIGLIEGTNVSVGRGTDTPFEVLGAPYVDALLLWQRLASAELPGVGFAPVHFTPTASKFAGETCHGVQVLVRDWRTFEPVRTGVHVACALRALCADDWQSERLDWLLKHEPTRAAIVAGAAPEAIVASFAKDEELFRLRRRVFLLYE